MKSKAAKQPNYMKRIIEKGLKVKEQLGPGVYPVPVYHDDWCDLLKQKGPCNCDPDVGEPERWNG